MDDKPAPIFNNGNFYFTWNISIPFIVSKNFLCTKNSKKFQARQIVKWKQSRIYKIKHLVRNRNFFKFRKLKENSYISLFKYLPHTLIRN